MELIREVTGILEREPRLIQLPSHGKAVFVGDTHGDLDATEKVISRFLKGADHPRFSGGLCGSRGLFERECGHPPPGEMGASSKDLSPGRKSRGLSDETLFPCQFLGFPFGGGERNLWSSLFNISFGCNLHEWHPGSPRGIA